MGLDNGLILYTRKPIDFPIEVKNYIAEYSTKENGFQYHYELCYWRKCYNLRREIGCALHTWNSEYVSKSNLTLGDVRNIWRAIHELYSKRTWEDGDSIWDWREIKPVLDRDFLVLEWLIFFMQENDNSTFMVEFYDSY